jgi:hypothetical protein
MALIVLEGLDRTGKTTVAKYYESIGYDLIHLSAPPKGTTPDQYMQEMSDILSSASTRDIVLDRSHYGELIWSQVYSRPSLLSEEDILSLKEIEDIVGVTRIAMFDPNVESHWKRCLDNNEPLDKPQFIKARSLYFQMAQKFNFESFTLPQFIKKNPGAEMFSDLNSNKESVQDKEIKITKTPEQLKLEKANAINDILSKKILKCKGETYEDIEKDIRIFLNTKLGKLLGNSSDTSLSEEEIKFYKKMYAKAMSK